MSSSDSDGGRVSPVPPGVEPGGRDRDDGDERQDDERR